MYCDHAGSVYRKGILGGAVGGVTCWSRKKSKEWLCVFQWRVQSKKDSGGDREATRTTVNQEKEKRSTSSHCKSQTPWTQGFHCYSKPNTHLTGHHVNRPWAWCTWPGWGPTGHRTCWAPDAVGPTGGCLSWILLLTLCKGEVCLWFSKMGWVFPFHL